MMFSNSSQQICCVKPLPPGQLYRAPPGAQYAPSLFQEEVSPQMRCPAAYSRSREEFLLQGSYVKQSAARMVVVWSVAIKAIVTVVADGKCIALVKMTESETGWARRTKRMLEAGWETPLDGEVR
jgi:hypothetical protein